MVEDAKRDALKSGNRRAWVIVVGLGFLMGAGLQTILAGAGNFIPLVCADLKCEPGELTLWITMYALFMALSQPVVGRLWPKVNSKLLVTVSFLISVVAMALMGTYTEVWQFWISGAVIGLSGGFYFMVAGPYLITNWFAKKTGLALGVMGIIGSLLGAILSPIDAAIIAAVGWRTGYFIVAAISCVMALPFTLFVFEYDPAKLGMRPVGWEEGAETVTAGAEDASGVPANKALISVPFIMLFLVGGIFALYGGYQNLWGFASAEWGYDPTFTSTMISATILFGLVGPLIGLVADRIGPWKTTFGIMAIQLLSGVGLLFFHSNQAVILVLVFFFAFQGAVVGMLMPLLARDTFGAKDYTKIFSYIQIGIGLIGAFSNPVVAFFYTAYGTFDAALVFAAAIAVISIVFTGIALVRKKPMQMAKWVESETEQDHSGDGQVLRSQV